MAAIIIIIIIIAIMLIKTVVVIPCITLKIHSVSHKCKWVKQHVLCIILINNLKRTVLKSLTQNYKVLSEGKFLETHVKNNK
jgi:uncharacterized SAM-binding protein YcdF (DUF218 family)